MAVALIAGLPSSAGWAGPPPLGVHTVEVPSGQPAPTITNFYCHIAPGKALPGWPAPTLVRPDCDIQPGPAAVAPLPPPPSCNSGCAPMNYHGGPTVTSSNQFFIWMNCPHTCLSDWGNPAGFLGDLFDSNFVHVLDQYMKPSVLTTSNRYTMHGNTCQAIISSPPHVMTDADVHNDIMVCINQYYNMGGGGGGYNQMYSFFLPPGQDLCMGSSPNISCYCPDNSSQCTSTTGNGIDFCAYHSSFDVTDVTGHSIHVIYQAMPYQDVTDTATGITCQMTGGPNGTLIDSTDNLFSHEIFETISDPDGNAWWRTSDGQEMGDLCQWIAIQNPIYLHADAYETQMQYSQAVQACVGAYKTLALSHDFNFDMMSDIAWHDTSGDVAIWLIQAGQATQSGSLGSVPTAWSIVGQRDFNGNGDADLLWHDTSGDVAMWFMNGVGIASSASLGNVPTIWSIVGTGDFNGDGKGDILWRDSSGNVALWLMNGSTVSQSSSLGNVPTNWIVAGVGDFNGDGKSDILWRDPTAGSVAIWLMNGASVTQSGSLGTVASNWVVAATGDFNGDGKSDILWRDPTAGSVAMWLMNGIGVTQSGSLGTVPTNWTVAETGDFDGDAKSDILWRDTAGDVAIWFMNGLQASSTSVGNVATTWTIQGTNSD